MDTEEESRDGEMKKKGHNHRTWDWCCLNSVGNQKLHSWNLEQTLGLFPRFITEAWKSSVRDRALSHLSARPQWPATDHRRNKTLIACFCLSWSTDDEITNSWRGKSLPQNTFQNYGETIGNQLWNYKLVLDSQMWCGQRRLLALFSEFFTVLWHFLLWMNPIQD